MLVPTVPLVDQQMIEVCQYLQGYMDDSCPEMPYWVDGFSSAENLTSTGRTQRFLSSDICVVTPQILMFDQLNTFHIPKDV